jgi:hypothetical protein
MARRKKVKRVRKLPKSVFAAVPNSTMMLPPHEKAVKLNERQLKVQKPQ